LIIDIHVHPPRKDGSLAAMDKMAEVARRSGIDRLCLLGRVGEHGYDPKPEQIQESNTETVATVRARPDTFLGFAYLNPSNDPSFTREEIQRTIVEGPLRGIKLWVAVNTRDSRLDPLMQRAEELGVPVLHHAWYKTVSHAYNESNPSDIAHLAARFPKVSIIMAHLSGCGTRGIADIKAHPNVCIETSGSQPEHGIVEWAVQQLGAKRVLFGSDATGRDFSCQLGRVLGADLTEKQRELVLSGNAKRLLRLVAT